jgi:hypothetical protein
MRIECLRLTMSQMGIITPLPHQALMTYSRPEHRGKKVFEQMFRQTFKRLFANLLRFCLILPTSAAHVRPS